MASPATANPVVPAVLLGATNSEDNAGKANQTPGITRSGSGVSQESSGSKRASERSNRSVMTTASQRAARLRQWGSGRSSTFSWDGGRRRRSLVPWYVRRQFKTKAFTLALIEFILVFGVTVLADQYVDSSQIHIAKPILWMSGVAALVAMCSAFFLGGRKIWVHYACLVVLTASSAVFWSMADVAVFADWADLPSQVLGIMVMVCLTSLLVAQIPPTPCCTKPLADADAQSVAEETKERILFVSGTLVGWFLGVSLCVAVMYNRHKTECGDKSRKDCMAAFATNTRIAAVATASLMTFLQTLALTIAAGLPLLRCDPDDFMTASLVMTISLYSAVAVVFLAFGVGVSEGMISCRTGPKAEKDAIEAGAIAHDAEVKQITAACDGQRTLRPPVQPAQSQDAKQVRETAEL